MKFRTLLMSAVGAVALVTTAALPINVAHADGNDAIAFTCTAHLGAFGVAGTHNGTCDGGTAIGLGEGTLVAPGSFSADFTYNEPPATCPALGNAAGTAHINGADEPFTWTRVGAVALISLPDETAGAGVATFAVTSPLGLPCGGAVTAIAAGAAVGIG